MLLLLLTSSQSFVYIHQQMYLGTIQATTYYDTNLTKTPSQKSEPLDRFFWKSISSMHLLLLTTSQTFMYIHQQMYVGAILATIYYDTKLTMSPSHRKWSPWQIFSENQSHPCSCYYWQLPKVSCISINKCRRYPGDNILWHTDRLTDRRVKQIIPTQLRSVGYN
jgi:hypothetical protein